MNCCNKGKQPADKSRWFLVCGLSVLALLAAVFIFKISPQNIFFYGIILACPLMHLLMMKGMGHGDKK